MEDLIELLVDIHDREVDQLSDFPTYVSVSERIKLVEEIRLALRKHMP